MAKIMLCDQIDIYTNPSSLIKLTHPRGYLIIYHMPCGLLLEPQNNWKYPQNSCNLLNLIWKGWNHIAAIGIHTFSHTFLQNILSILRKAKAHIGGLQGIHQR